MRRPDWQQRLSSYLEEREKAPFAWGSNDCCAFAAGAVEAVTGVDHLTVFGRYESASAARALIRSYGGLEALVSVVLGPSVSPQMAAVGDIVLLVNEGRKMLGLCNGTSVMAPGRLGIAVAGIEAAIAAWKV